MSYRARSYAETTRASSLSLVLGGTAGATGPVGAAAVGSRPRALAAAPPGAGE